MKENTSNQVGDFPTRSKVNLAPLTLTRVADLRFLSKQLPKGTCRLLVSQDGKSLTGCLMLRNQIFHGSGEVISDGRTETWLFASSLVGEARPASLNISISWTKNRGTGSFAIARGRRNGGGRLKALLRQEQGDGPAKDEDALAKKCGKFISRTSFTNEDPEGKHKTQWVLLHFQKCDFLKQIDDDEEPIGGTVEPKRDGTGAPFTKGGVTVTPLSLSLNSSPVGKTTEKRSGQVRIFYISGCKNTRVVQYVKSGVTFQPPETDKNAKMPKDSNNDWHLDIADPYPGAIVNDNGDTVVSDIPAAYESEVAQAANVKSLPKGATATYTWELETFIYCDGNLLLWLSWGGSVVFTMGDDGKLTPGAPSVDPPKQHGPDEASQSDGNKKK